MKPVFSLFAGVIGAVSVSAGPLTDNDRQQLLEHLENSQQMFAAALHNVSPAQARFKPAPGRWSILVCAEHLPRSNREMGRPRSDPEGMRPAPRQDDRLRRAHRGGSAGSSLLRRHGRLSAVARNFGAYPASHRTDERSEGESGLPEVTVT
jgi:hypothetical protein